MYLSDYHTHTNFSGDSTASPESMIKGAMVCQLKELCITDHLDLDYPNDPDLFLMDLPAYADTIHKLKEQYVGQINLKFGIELGLQPHLSEQLSSIVSTYPWDFIIGSSHVVNKMDPYFPEFWDRDTAHNQILRYFETIPENLKAFSDFDVYGHIDYIVRYCPDKTYHYSCMDYWDILEHSLQLLINAGKGIEVNTAGYKFNLSQPNPHADILKRYRELGGEIITIGSDAHSPEFLAYHFDDTIELLKNCGFRYFTTFDKRQPIFHPLH